MKAQFVFANIEAPSEETRDIFAGIIQVFLHSLNQPAAPTPPAEFIPPARIPAAHRKTKATQAKPYQKAVEQAETPAQFGPTTQKVVEYLRKRGPSTTLEIVKGLPDLKDGVIYPTLSALRKRGLLRNAPIDGKVGSFNFLVEAK